MPHTQTGIKSSLIFDMKRVNSRWFLFLQVVVGFSVNALCAAAEVVCLNHAVTMRVDYGVCYWQKKDSLSLSLSTLTGREGQCGRESESPYHQHKCPVERASRMILSSYLFLLTGTSRSRQRGGCEGREGLPSKCCQSLPVCWHDCFADELCTPCAQLHLHLLIAFLSQGPYRNSGGPGSCRATG